MSWTPPSASDFKAFFNRDFSYAPPGDPDNLDYITDADINKAISMALVNFRPTLFGSDSQITTIFLWLVAFYLASSLLISEKGISSQANFPINSESVGGVSLAFTIPERYLKSPFLSQYTANGYGMTYLSLVLPFTVGNVAILRGTTTST